PHAGVVQLAIANSGVDYAATIIPDVNVGIADNDIAGVTVRPVGAGTHLVEGGATDTYALFLDTEPTQPVDIQITPDTQVNITSPSTLTFDAGNWSAPQVVTIEAVDDAIAEGIHTGVASHA